METAQSVSGIGMALEITPSVSGMAMGSGTPLAGVIFELEDALSA